MGKAKPKTEVTEYYMSEHFGICSGADALLKLTIKEKEAWVGSQFELGEITINDPELFGGVKKEGGLRGIVHYLPGASDQLLPDALAQKLGRADGADCPGFRGLASLFFVGDTRPGFYWTANSPYLPGVWATVRRAPIGLNPDYALIPVNPADEGDTFSGEAVLAWWQHSRIGAAPDRDHTALRIRFFDVYGLPLSAYIGPGADLYCPVWTERSITTEIPEGTTTIQVVIDMSPGALSNRGGYVDDITLTIDGVPITLANPDAETGDNSGWITTSSNDLTNRTATPASHSGSYYFGYPGNFKVRAYQDISAVAAVDLKDANPAHMIYECLTNTDWGMGSPLAALDTDEFETAAVTLYNEGFGLSMIWTRQSSIQDFVQEILDHIQAVIFVDPSTGLLTLKLIRDDYDAEYLPEITPDNADLSSFGRKLWGDIVNEITVTWTNPENEQEETITAQDDASIATQGGIVPDSRNYYGVRNAALAQKLAWRDLRSSGQPLASCEAEVNRTQWDLRPASVVKLTWPEYSLSEIVMRVTSIDYGKPGDPTIKLSLMEDVYGLDIGTYDDPPSSEWEDPSSQPEAFDTVEILTLPLFFAADTTVAAFIENPEYPEVLAGVLATTANADAYAYELWDEVTLPNGSLEWQSLGTNNIIGRGELVVALAAEAETAGVSFENVTGQTIPTIGGFIIIGSVGEEGNEIAMVDADNGDDYGYDLIRGVLDTVPRAWPVGTPAWFVDGSTLFEDSLIRAAAEEVDYKLRMQTSQGMLPLAGAPLETYTLTERPWLPNRPADVEAYGEAWSSEFAPIDARERVDPWITVTWANRNRLTEDSQVLAWTDATVTPETGQTTTIEVRDADGVLLTTHDGLTGISFDVPDASFDYDNIVRLRVYSERADDDGSFVSLQFFEHWVQVGGGSLLLSGDASDGDDYLLLSGDESGRVTISGA